MALRTYKYPTNTDVRLRVLLAFVQEVLFCACGGRCLAPEAEVTRKQNPWASLWIFQIFKPRACLWIYFLKSWISFCYSQKFDKSSRLLVFLKNFDYFKPTVFLSMFYFNGLISDWENTRNNLLTKINTKLSKLHWEIYKWRQKCKKTRPSPALSERNPKSRPVVLENLRSEKIHVCE